MSKTELLQSKYFKTATITIGIVLIALISFAIGMDVGFHKAKFSYTWGDNYERNFVGPPMPPPPGPMGFFRDFEDKNFRNAHGVSGEIISIADNALVIKDRDNKENTITVSDKTLIKKHREDLDISGLKQGDEIVVVGNPNDNGVINADIIRVFEQ